MRDVCTDFGCELAEFNGEDEHVHLLANFPSTVAISRLVNRLEGVSSRRLRQEFPDLRRHCWRPGAWGPGPSPGQPACPRHGLAPVHRVAEPPRLTSSHPAAITIGPKAGALAAIFGTAAGS
jgi:hypothetical protein